MKDERRESNNILIKKLIFKYIDKPFIRLKSKSE